MQTITYDRLPEDYDLHELAILADIASTYLGDKIRYIIASAIPSGFQSCTTSEATVSLQPDHSWFVSGIISLDPDRSFTYTAVLELPGVPDYVSISPMYSQKSRTAPIDSEAIKAVFTEYLE